MDPKFYIQWNLPNWITVILMVSLGTALFGVVASGIATYSDRQG